MPRVVLTGGPGAGKTTLLRELGSLGYPTVDESARAIISERTSSGLAPRPPAREFAHEILRRDIENYRRCADTTGWVFFDRGVVEAFGMVAGTEPMKHAELEARLAAFPMHRRVFVLPPWPEIYTQDAERDQDFEESVRVHAKVVDWYLRCGYVPLEVPRLRVRERATHVLHALGLGDASRA